VLQNGGGSGVPILKAHEPRDPAQQAAQRTLAAGNEPTPWHGLVVLRGAGERFDPLAVAAGKRGLLVLPAQFSAATKAMVVDTKGPCLDRVVRGDLLLALVGQDAKKCDRGGPRTELQAFRWSRKEVTPAGHFSLTGIYTSFVT
jgi:hypothetical protein